MADLANLRTASLYINNQLLSRGLLRDGRAIDFADPAGGDSTADSTADTMGRVIGVVNDLILRRDRDAEHRESLSTALRTVRAESLRQANDLQRALERHADAQRRADLGEAAETSLRAQLAAAEAANRKLREDAARMRQLVAQTRASCANDVRKRDRQIDGLKRAVTDAGRARGERRSPAIMTITIGGGGEHHHQQPQQQPRSAFTSPQSTPTTHSSATATTAANATTNSEYDLRGETNAFLAELARGLSDDNETLLGLVRYTSRHLKAMSGYAVAAEEAEADAEAQGTQTQGDRNDASPVADCGALAREMEAVLEHLRTILTNPSFVPIEEVVQRESEIGRLRDGWEKMEDRWKEAVHLLDGWRRRMAVSGRPVNMEEIKMGLRLSPVRVRHVAETSQGLDLRLPPLHEGLEDEDEGESEGENGNDDGGDFPPLGRTPSPAETLHLMPAPGARGAEQYYGREDDGGLSDSDSDASSIFADDDEPNVQIIEQSVIMPSLEASPAPVAFSRSTPSPSPPPPEKPALSKVTAAALKEKEQEQQKVTSARPTQQGLRPSQTAGNRGGLGGPTTTASATETKKEKETSAAVTRGRRRPGEITAIVEETTRDLKQVQATQRPTAKPAASRITATATTGINRANSTKTNAPRPVPTKQAKPAAPAATTGSSRPATAAAALAQEKQRPASAASQASEASAASSSSSNDSVALVPSAGPATTSRPVSSLASRKPAAATAASSRPRPDRLNKQASDGKAAAATASSSSASVPATASSSDQMPPPPAPTTTASAATTAPTALAANRARSRSPTKLAIPAATATTAISTASGAAGVTSRLPLPTTATGGAVANPASSNIPPPPSPALNMATIAAKLAASEREADAARVRAKLKAVRGGVGAARPAKAAPTSSTTSITTSVRTVSGGSDAAAPAPTDDADSVDPVKKTVVVFEAGDEEEFATSVNANDPQQQQQQPLRKKRDQRDHRDQRRASRVASRRRSTLNPWELASLMTGGVGSAEGAAAEAEL